MPLGTDLSRLLTKEEPATPQEAETIRMELNRLQSQVSALSGLVDVRGNLDANIFSHKSGQFSVLPGETASMYAATNQTIAHETNTFLVFDADAGLTASQKLFSWAHGVKREQSTGKFYLEGIPNETIWQFTCWLYWDAVPDNFYIYLAETAESSYHLLQLHGTTSSWGVEIATIMMKARKSSSTWQMLVWQSMGDESSKATSDAIFQVTRIR